MRNISKTCSIIRILCPMQLSIAGLQEFYYSVLHLNMFLPDNIKAQTDFQEGLEQLMIQTKSLWKMMKTVPGLFKHRIFLNLSALILFPLMSTRVQFQENGGLFNFLLAQKILMCIYAKLKNFSLISRSPQNFQKECDVNSFLMQLIISSRMASFGSELLKNSNLQV